jgi:hypothetical protein
MPGQLQRRWMGRSLSSDTTGWRPLERPPQSSPCRCVAQSLPPHGQAATRRGDKTPLEPPPRLAIAAPVPQQHCASNWRQLPRCLLRNRLRAVEQRRIATAALHISSSNHCHRPITLEQRPGASSARRGAQRWTRWTPAPGCCSTAAAPSRRPGRSPCRRARSTTPISSRRRSTRRATTWPTGSSR